MPVHHQTGTHLSETREGIRDTISSSKTPSPLKSRIVLDSRQPHLFHNSLLDLYLSFKIFSCSLSLYLFSFAPSLLLVASAFSSLFSLSSAPHPPLCPLKNCPKANNITDTRAPLFSFFCSHSLPSSLPLTRDIEQCRASCESIHQCQAKYSLDDWQDRCRIHPRNMAKQLACYPEFPPNGLILFSPRKSLTQISKENVRLFCSSGVICHNKQLSFTSGEVEALSHWPAVCRVASAINKAVSVQFIPSLFTLFTHTFAVFMFLLQAVVQELSNRLEYLPSTHGCFTRNVSIRFFHHFCSVMRNIFQRGIIFTEKSVDEQWARNAAGMKSILWRNIK